LDAPVPFSAAISPVCLAPPSNNPDQYANKQAAAMGWGDLKEGKKKTTNESCFYDASLVGIIQTEFNQMSCSKLRLTSLLTPSARRHIQIFLRI
jgi:hypothetical protein